MYVALAEGGPTLVAPQDTKSFKVVAADGLDADRILRHAQWGRLDGDEALIRVEQVRAAAGDMSAGWESDFAAMLDYARTKGWLTSDGAEIRAHVERRTA